MRSDKTAVAALFSRGSAIACQLLLLSVAHAQSPTPRCPVELLDARWRPKAHSSSLGSGQEAILDLKYANRSPREIQEITVVFKSTFVVHGAMGQNTLPAERTLTFESTAAPGKSGYSQLEIGPSSPGRGVVRLESLVFRSGLKWKSEEGSACSAPVH